MRIFKALGVGPMLLVPLAALAIFFATGGRCALLPRIATGFVWVHASVCAVYLLILTVGYYGAREVFERAAQRAAGRMPPAWKACFWHGLLVPMLWMAKEHVASGMMVATFVAATYSRSLVQGGAR